jgi:hypothetical protein
VPKVKTENAKRKSAIQKTEKMIDELHVQLLDLTEFPNLTKCVIKAMNDLEELKKGFK